MTESASDPPRSGTPTVAGLPRIALSLVGDDFPGPDASGQADLEITGVLGEGGMGRVYVARQCSLDREVAVKVVHPDVRDPTAVAKLIAEGVITGSMEHPSIVPVHAMGVAEDGRPVLVMKKVEGFTWLELLRDPSHLGWTKLPSLPSDQLTAHLEILLHVCNAIELAHARGIVHRDIKPANVMVGSFGEVYVVDWGLAARMDALSVLDRSRKHTVVGTPAYMAPELVSPAAGRVDARTDVYLLGATLHEILTGHPRHSGNTLLEVLCAAYEARPFTYASQLPIELVGVCRRATESDPARRYPSVRELRQAISDYLHHRGSIELTRVARARLEEIDTWRSRPPLVSVREGETLHRVMAECRFGFMQAVHAWPDNEAARTGLECCLEKMIDHALAERRPVVARSLLGELGQPRPTLQKRIEALEATLAAERVRHHVLDQMEQDLDLAVSTQQRVRAMGVITAMAAVTSAMTCWVAVKTGHEPSNQLGLAIETVSFVVIATLVLSARKALFRNAANRRVVIAIMTTVVSVLLNRITGMMSGAPIATIVTSDALCVGSVLAMVAATTMPWLWYSVPLWVLTALVTNSTHGAATSIFAVAMALTGAIVFERWRRSLLSDLRKRA